MIAVEGIQSFHAQQKARGNLKKEYAFDVLMLFPALVIGLR